jgi:hypothetical protein
VPVITPCLHVKTTFKDQPTLVFLAASAPVRQIMSTRNFKAASSMVGVHCRQSHISTASLRAGLSMLSLA